MPHQGLRQSVVSRALHQPRRNPEDAVRIDAEILPGLEPPTGRSHMSQQGRSLKQECCPVTVGRDDLVQIGGPRAFGNWLKRLVTDAKDASHRRIPERSRQKPG